jgi:lipopolysaccharide export system permease protein
VSRVDWIVLKRIISRIALTVLIFFGLILLVESIDSARYNYLMQIGGVQLAVLGMVSAAAGWLAKGLPLLVLVGTVVGVVDLQSRRELTAIKSSGASMWRVMRAPALAILLFGFFVTFYGDGVLTMTNRSLDANMPGASTAFSSGEGMWLEQTSRPQRYVVHVQHVLQGGLVETGFTAFLPDGMHDGRIVAPTAYLKQGYWLLPKATRYRAGARPEQLTDFQLPTDMTFAELQLKFKSTENMTLYELAASLGGNLTDPVLRNAVLTRFLKLLCLPALLVGSLFIAFAYTAGYRRSNGYGRAIIFAILTGFVVFVVTEMADRAGSAGVLDPIFAAAGPAFVTLVIGLTILLYKEDGWA